MSESAEKPKARLSPKRKNKPLWVEMRDDYVFGGLTIKEIANKHGKSYATVNSRCSNEKWVELRNEIDSKSLARAEERAISARADSIEDFNSTDLALAKAMKQQAGEIIREAQSSGKPLPPVNLNSLSNTLRNAQIIGRTALGINVDRVAVNTTDGGKKSMEDFTGDIDDIGIDELYDIARKGRK
jgi:hypothetical protein